MAAETNGGLQLRSTVRDDETLELALIENEIPEPLDDEVIIRIEAAPINPSDLGLLFGPADMSTATVSGTDALPVITASIPTAMMRSAAPKWASPCRSAMRVPAS